MTHLVLGIDGGGTSTRVVIADETGQVRGVGRAGSSNHDDVGYDGVLLSLGRAVKLARLQAGIDQEFPFDAVYLGMAGVVSDHDRHVIRSVAADLGLAPPETTRVHHDIRTALAGGLSGRPGIALIAGTGSSCFGINAQGDEWRSGGWGHLIDDEGSGYWLGIMAMKAAIMAHDARGPATELAGAVMRALDISDMNDIMHRIYVPPMSRTEIAALAPLVISAASRQDEVAIALIKKGMDALADCALAVARRLRLDQDESELALIGGIFSAGDIVLNPLKQAVCWHLPACKITLAEHPPVIGAALLAYETLGITATEPIKRHLSESFGQAAWNE